LSVEEIERYLDGRKIVTCPECNGTSEKIITRPTIHVFKDQILRDLQDANPPRVANRQQLKDAINRFNDSAFAAEHGKVAVK
jgi:uncharacterized protein YcgI (DUF1989 family)